MKVKNIQEMNEAVFILRHFIDLSARLLPLLFTLDQKIEPSPEESRNKEKILSVFKSYKFETDTSKLLLESNILELIKICYLNVIYEVPSVNKQAGLANFLNEYNRLKKNWRMIENN
jgi:hypothetical protein